MAGDLAHLADRLVILVIRVVPPLERNSVTTKAPPPLVEEPLGEIEILLLACRLVKLYQSELYLLMARHPVTFAGAKDGHHVVSHLDADIQQLTFTRHIEIGDSSLDHVAGAIHLVGIHPRPAIIILSKGERGVEIAILLLGCGEFVYPFVALSLQDRIRVVLEGIGHSLKCLVHIRVVIYLTFMLSDKFLGCFLEITNTACLVLYLVYANLESDILVALEPRGPKAIIDLHVREIDRRDQLGGGGLLTLPTGRKDESHQHNR